MRMVLGHRPILENQMGKTMLNEMAPTIRCPRNKDCSIVQFIGGGGGNAALMQYKAGCGFLW